nr:pentapeptide repeat-containing protein [Peristeroidobacter agariperforans]
MSKLDDVNLEGANLSDLKAGADMRNQPMGLIRIVLTHASLKGANLEGAKLGGAILTDAQIHNAIFVGATGLKEVLGLDSTQGKETATFDP